MKRVDRIEMENGMEEEINADRRRFLGTAAMTLAAVPFGAIDAAAASTHPKTAAAIAGMPPASSTHLSALSTAMREATLATPAAPPVSDNEGPRVRRAHRGRLAVRLETVGRAIHATRTLIDTIVQ